MSGWMVAQISFSNSGLANTALPRVAQHFIDGRVLEAHLGERRIPAERLKFLFRPASTNPG